MNATAWTYQAPRRPGSHPDQCYYRAVGLHRVEPCMPAGPEVTLFRFESDDDAEITLRVTGAQIQGRMNRESMLALRDALNDALQDIEAVEADRERRESFEAIQDELRDLEEGQQSGYYFIHPDVHYVPADQVVDKVQELEAAGVKRYLVMPDPGAVSDQQPLPLGKSSTAKDLCEELAAFCSAHGLAYWSADDLAESRDVTDAQRVWLRDYQARWMACMAVPA